MDGDSAPSFLDQHPLAEGFCVDGWTVVPRAYELVRSGETRHLQPKPMEVLVYLAARAGQVVSRDDLMAAVWPEVYVSEHALNRCISQLRKLFEDDAREPRVIETIPKAGYRLMVPVEWLPGDSARAPLGTLDLTVASHPALAPAAPSRSSRTVLIGVLLLALISVSGVGLLNRQSSPIPTVRAWTVAPGTEGQPSWSPDGQHLAYTHQEERGAEGLYVQTLGEDVPRRLTDDAGDFSPAWSPDGQTLFFARCRPAHCGVYSIPMVGGAIRQVEVGPVWSTGLDVAPDGHTLAASIPDSTGLSIVLIDFESGERQRLTTPPRGFMDVAPTFSPDGQWIAFQRRSEVGADVYKVPVAGGEAAQLTTDARPLAGHTWLGDGESLVFSSMRTGYYALWQIPAGGGEPEAISVSSVRDPGELAFTSAGQRLVVEDWAFEINLWEVAEGAEPVRRVASTLWDRQPHLSSDGQRLAFISNRTGSPEVWTAARDGSDLQRLTDFGGAAVGHPRVSPDGQRIVFQVRVATQADLYLYEADGAVRRLTTTAEADEVAPRWSRDGHFLYYGSAISGDWQVWRLRVADGKREQVTQQGGYTAEEAADGSILVVRYHEPGLWRMAQNDVERISDWPALGDWGTWAVTEQGVLVVERGGEEPRVIAVDPATGIAVPRALFLSDLVENEPSLTATADGVAIVTAQVDRVASDLLVVEPFE